MGKYSIFDILGPIMIGPSSSHTAGAARMAKTALTLCAEPVKEVRFCLHGSFAMTYKGHGTDKALVAGMLGMDPWDERLRDAFKLAEKSLQYTFEEVDLGDVHPNTVKFIMKTVSGKTKEVTGSSIGGGNIKIFNIDGNEVEFFGDKTTIVTEHKDIPGVIFEITKALLEKNINIGNMKVLQKKKGEMASMSLDTDSPVEPEVIESLKELDFITNIIVLNPIA